MPAVRMAANILKVLVDRSPEGRVSPRWLLRSSSSINRAFVASSSVGVVPDGDFQIVTINGERYAWPADVPLDVLLVCVAELQDPRHPHRYLHGHTTIHPGEVVLDIGACEGGFAALAAGIGARTIAVEPSRMMRRVIERLFELRGLGTAEVLECLLGPNTGEAWFLDYPGDPGRSRIEPAEAPGAYRVPMLTLDAAVERLGVQRLDFIKCDAEGADVPILKSGPETLRRFKPKLAICTYHAGGDYNELAAYLSQFGYRIEGKGYLYTGRKFHVMMLHAWCA